MIRRFSLFLLGPAFQALTSFLILPLTTFKLEPQDFGRFALLSAFSGTASTLASLGGSFLLSSHFPGASVEEKRGLSSTVLWGGMVLLSLLIGAFLGFWYLGGRALPIFRDLSSASIFLTAGTALLSFPWVFAADILTLERDGWSYAAILTLKALVAATAVLLSLYSFELGPLSLFLASFAGSVALFMGSIYSMRAWIRPVFDRKWARKNTKLGFFMFALNITSEFYNVLERTLISSRLGFSTLGIYTHSQQYRDLMGMAANSLKRTVWPTTLDEAKHPEGRFTLTHKSWTLGFVGFTLAGVFFATLGSHVIGWLTHGKFNSAANIAALWMVFFLIQYSGMPLNGVLFSRDRARIYSIYHLIGAVLAIAWVWVSLPYLGVYGAVSALILQQLTFRVGAHLYVRKRKIPCTLRDGWVALGVFVILLSMTGSRWIWQTLLTHLILFVGISSLVLFLARKEILSVGLKLRRNSL